MERSHTPGPAATRATPLKRGFSPPPPLKNNMFLTKPLMLYDGDCAFCQHWTNHWRAKTSTAIDYAPYQERHADFPQISKAACQKAVQLISINGETVSGAAAVLHAFALAGHYQSFLSMYHHLPGFAMLCEACYRFIAHHRIFLSQLFGHRGRCEIKK